MDFLLRLNHKIEEALSDKSLTREVKRRQLKLMRLQAKNERAKVRDRLEKDIDTAPVDESYLRGVENRLDKALEGL